MAHRLMRMDQKGRGGIWIMRGSPELSLGMWCWDVQSLVIWEQLQGPAWCSVKCWWTEKRKMLFEPFDLSSVRGEAHRLVLRMLPWLKTCWWVVLLMLLRAKRKKKSFWSLCSEIFLFFFPYVRKIETKWGENKNKNEKNPTNPLCISNASVSRLYGNDTSTHPFSSPLSFPSFHYSPSTLSDVSIVSEAPTGAL